MTPKHILIIAIRLLTLVWCIQTLQTGTALHQLAMENSFNVGANLWLSYAVYAVIWLFLWFFPSTVANLLLPKHAQAEQPLPKHPAAWLTCGVILIGIWTLANALAEGSYWYTLSRLYVDNSHISAWSLFNNEQKASVVITAVEAVLGAILVFGAPKISHIIRNIL